MQPYIFEYNYVHAGRSKTMNIEALCSEYTSLMLFIILQINIFVLAWSRDGQMLGLWEKVILPLLTVYMFLLIILGNVAVSISIIVLIIINGNYNFKTNLLNHTLLGKVSLINVTGDLLSLKEH